MKKIIQLNKEQEFKARCVLSRLLVNLDKDMSKQESILYYMAKVAEAGVLLNAHRYKAEICEHLGITRYIYENNIRNLKDAGLLLLEGSSYILHPMLNIKDGSEEIGIRIVE